MDPTRNESNVYIHYMPAPTQHTFTTYLHHIQVQTYEQQDITTAPLGGGNSNILDVSSRSLGRFSSNLTLTNIFQMGWFNHKLAYDICYIYVIYVYIHVHHIISSGNDPLFPDVNPCFILIGSCWFRTSSLATWAWPRATLHLPPTNGSMISKPKPAESLHRTWKPISPNKCSMNEIYIYKYIYINVNAYKYTFKYTYTYIYIYPYIYLPSNCLRHSSIDMLFFSRETSLGIFWVFRLRLFDLRGTSSESLRLQTTATSPSTLVPWLGDFSNAVESRQFLLEGLVAPRKYI